VALMVLVSSEGPASAARAADVVAMLDGDIDELDARSLAERIALEQALAATDGRYVPQLDTAGPRLATPMRSIEAHFSPSGAHLTLARGGVTLRASALGRGTSMARLPVTAGPSIDGPAVRTERGAGVIEWWRSLPSGLEHGVTIGARPRGEGPLTLELTLHGDLSARALSADEVGLFDADGTLRAVYAHLLVLDAGGAIIAARLGVRDGRIVIAIDDAHARYPLVIDPLLIVAEEATLLAAGVVAGDSFGSDVAMSHDGSRMVVGASSDSTPLGSRTGTARILRRAGSVWSEEAELRAGDAFPSDGLGVAVAITADGSRVIVGAKDDDLGFIYEAGTARIFVRSGTTWTEEATLSAAGFGSGDQLGNAVAISADGTRALVGANLDDTTFGINAGSARVFVRSGTTWTEEATFLPATGTNNDQFGTAVALSSDGSRAFVGAPLADTAGGTDAGLVRVFVRTGTSWAPEATLLAPDGAANDALGTSVSISTDGSRALIGAPRDTTTVGHLRGSARVFLRAGSSWAQEGTLLAADGRESDYFGVAVGLSADGSRAIVGADRDDTTAGVDGGSARGFVRMGTSWAEGATLISASSVAGDFFGGAVAIAGDGSRAAVGTPQDDTAGDVDAGSVTVFTLVAGDRANGTACTSGTTCLSGFCVDSVCCDGACGGGASDCQACSAALTGGPSGTCAALSAAVAPGMPCRSSEGACDVAEVCSPTSTACPLDGFLPPTTVCRALSGACDAREETCTGTSASCPVDAPADAGFMCRESAGGCDAAEACDGASYACPADVRIPAGVVCRSVGGPCDSEERCNGASAACPSDAFLSAAVVCRSSIGFCDVEDRCNGASSDCIDVYRPAGTECAPSGPEVCDAPDVCAGTSADCIGTFRADVECRASMGGCDPAELCTGDVATCPPDQVSPAGTVCRASTELVCDPLESCDGRATSCPADISTCPDGGGRADGGGVAPDAGVPAAATGCACRAGTTSHRGAPVALVFALSALWALRRRSAARAA